MTLLAPTLQAFFTDRLVTQRELQPSDDRRLPRHVQAAARASPHERTGKQPFELDIDDLDAPLIGAFLNHLENDRGNSPAPATPGWRRSTRSTDTPRSSTPSTPPRSAG